MKNIRAIAARTIVRVMRGRSLDDALAQAPAVPVRDRALLQAMAYGVVRDWRLLGEIARSLSQRPSEIEEIDALLRVGLYQLRSMRVPAHAAVQETVAASTILKQPQARAFVNAVLRRYQREQAGIEAALPGDPAIRHSHPDWLVSRLRADWGARCDSLLAANQQPGPMSLRVNVRRMSRADYLARLGAQGIAAHAPAAAPEAVVLAQPTPVQEVPGFTRGSVSVQDASAQLAVRLLEAQAGQRVLDACAAPGGKTAHILERCPDAQVLALDHDRERLLRIDENLRRLRLKGEVISGDAAKPSEWWDGRPFARILLDAPCSATGVIRRHPDIKWLRRPEDIGRLAATQVQLLDALWPLLAEGGLLVYASCSVLGEEGAGVVQPFLERTPNARELPIEADWGEAARVGRRIAPGGDFDGFYYARLHKKTAG